MQSVHRATNKANVLRNFKAQAAGRVTSTTRLMPKAKHYAGQRLIRRISLDTSEDLLRNARISFFFELQC